MPRFSLVVTAPEPKAHQLSGTVDSVLRQPFADVEAIVVASGAGDVPGAAGGDPRLAVLDDGPGTARNRGLAAARGDYVLFLDAGDTLREDALPAVDARLRETGDPDVLIFDHERIHWWRGGRGSALQRLFDRAPDGAFALDQHPALPDPLVPPCSAAHRRAFLAEHGLAFAPGGFADRAWSALTVLHAERLALLDRICVSRTADRREEQEQRPGTHHFELFDRFDEVMARAAELGAARAARAFRQLTPQILAATANSGRLAPEQQRAFFRRALDVYRSHRPDGFEPPGGSMGMQHKLLSAGSYPLYRTAQRLNRLTGRSGSGRSDARTASPRQQQHARYRSLLSLPVDDGLAVYSSYWGRGYVCNPAAIHRKARELAPHISSVLLVTEEALPSVPDGIDCAVAGSDRYWEVLARAKYAFNNVNFEHVVRKRPGTVHVQTQHGTPLKKMGLDQVDYPAAAAGIGSFGNLLKRVDRWDYNLSSNPHSTEVWERAFPGHYQSLDYGYPRNDVYYTAGQAEVDAVRGRLGIPPDRIAILYAPTFREYRKGFRSQFDLAEFCAALDDRFVVLLRAHHVYGGRDALDREAGAGRLIDVTGHPSTEDVCLAADALVTDYSSVMFDYANLDRPIVVFADDWDVYRATRGAYFDLPAAAPGPVARSGAELVRIFDEAAWDTAEDAERRHRFRERFCTFDDGFAAERVVRRVLLGEAPEAIRPVVPLDDRRPAPRPHRTATAP